jgi:exosortase/archaeosortase
MRINIVVDSNCGEIESIANVDGGIMLVAAPVLREKSVLADFIGFSSS